MTRKLHIGEITRYPGRSTMHVECCRCDWNKNKIGSDAARAALVEHHEKSHPMPVSVYIELPEVDA